MGRWRPCQRPGKSEGDTVKLVSVLDRAVTIELDPEELFALAEAMEDAGDGYRNRTHRESGDQSRLMLLAAWGAAFKGMAMSGASCSYIDRLDGQAYSLRTIERQAGERRARRRA